MEALPLELQEHIFSYLLPYIDYATITAVPVSSDAERLAVYNLRLTSRIINAGATNAFVQVIEDVPTRCTQEGLQNLAELTELPGLSQKITRLAFNTSKLYIGRSHEEQTLDYVRLMSSVRDAWLKVGFQEDLSTILQRVPRFEHLVCLPSLISGVAVEKFGWRRMMALRRLARSAEDPLPVCNFHRNGWPVTRR